MTTKSRAEILAELASAAKQDTGNTALASILAKLIATPATEAKQDTGNTSLATIAGLDFATQTTLAALLAKVIAAPSTEAKQDTANTALAAIKTAVEGTVDVQLTGSILQDAVTLQNNVSADGNGAVATVAGLATAVFQVSGTFVANINFEASIDGVTFVPLTVTHVGNGGIFTVANAPALYRASISGLSHIRARVSGRSSGNVTVTVRNTVTVTANKHVSTQGRFDLRGLAASRPLPATVPLGAIYLSVDTRAIDMSNGTSWVSLGVI